MSTPRPSLRDSLADYLNLRRALGFQLANAGRLLEQLVGDLERHGIDTVTTEHAVRWATLPADASRHWLAIRVSVVRGFTVYLHSIDSSAEIVPAGLIRPGACRATPYLYSEAEIGSLVEAAGGLRPRLRAATYQSLISLLAITGIRIGEAIALDDDDFDVEHEVLVLHHTKFKQAAPGAAAPERDAGFVALCGPAATTAAATGQPGAVCLHRGDPAAAQQHQPDLRWPGRAGRAHPTIGGVPAQNS